MIQSAANAAQRIHRQPARFLPQDVFMRGGQIAEGRGIGRGVFAALARIRGSGEMLIFLDCPPAFFSAGLLVAVRADLNFAAVSADELIKRRTASGTVVGHKLAPLVLTETKAGSQFVKKIAWERRKLREIAMELASVVAAGKPAILLPGNVTRGTGYDFLDDFRFEAGIEERCIVAKHGVELLRS